MTMSMSAGFASCQMLPASVPQPMPDHLRTLQDFSPEPLPPEIRPFNAAATVRLAENPAEEVAAKPLQLHRRDKSRPRRAA